MLIWTLLDPFERPRDEIHWTELANIRKCPHTPKHDSTTAVVLKDYGPAETI